MSAKVCVLLIQRTPLYSTSICEIVRLYFILPATTWFSASQMLCTHPDVFISASTPDLFRYQISDGKFRSVHIINVPVVHIINVLSKSAQSNVGIT